MTLGEVRMTQVQHLFLGPSQCQFFYTSCHPLTSALGMGGKASFSPFLQMEDTHQARREVGFVWFRGKGQQGLRGVCVELPP